MIIQKLVTQCLRNQSDGLILSFIHQFIFVNWTEWQNASAQKRQHEK